MPVQGRGRLQLDAVLCRIASKDAAGAANARCIPDHVLAQLGQPVITGEASRGWLSHARVICMCGRGDSRVDRVHVRGPCSGVPWGSYTGKCSFWKIQLVSARVMHEVDGAATRQGENVLKNLNETCTVST